MQYIAPLVQTVLWVALIGGIVWRFHRPIYGLLVALQKRVEGGGSVKAGPFELSELKPQEPARQREKLQLEIAAEPAAVPPSAAPSLPAPLSQQPPITFNPKEQQARRTALLLQAEDLALRAIQADYGQTVQRQVTAGQDPGFDGVFTIEGRVSVVEVKFVAKQSLMVTIPRMQGSLERLAASIDNYQWHNPRLLIAIVFESESDVPRSDTHLRRMVSDLPVEVTIRVFALPELRRRFGITEDDA